MNQWKFHIVDERARQSKTLCGLNESQVWPSTYYIFDDYSLSFVKQSFDKIKPDKRCFRCYKKINVLTK